MGPRRFTNSLGRNFFLCGDLGKFGVSSQGMWAKSWSAEMSICPLYVGHGHGSSSGMLLYNWLICSKSCEISTSLRFHDKCNRYTVRRSVLPARKNNHVALVIDWQWGRLDLTQGSESMFCLSILETIDYIRMHFDFCNRAYFCMYMYTKISCIYIAIDRCSEIHSPCARQCKWKESFGRSWQNQKHLFKLRWRVDGGLKSCTTLDLACIKPLKTRDRKNNLNPISAIDSGTTFPKKKNHVPSVLVSFWRVAHHDCGSKWQ